MTLYISGCVMICKKGMGLHPKDTCIVNEKNVEECLPIILERVIHTMLNQPGEHRDE